MMDFDGEEVRKEYKEAFGVETKTLTEAQLWWMVKVIKHCRGRCRSNAALNNYLKRNFDHAMFTTVDKINEKGEHYDGLVICVPCDGPTLL